MELDWLKKWNLYSPQAIAIQDGDTGQRISYSELFHSAMAGAAYLKKQGIQSGDRLAVIAQNCPEMIALFFAAQRVGAILVPINYRLKAPEVAFILSDCEPTAFFFHPEFQELAHSACGKFKTLPLVGASSFAEEIVNSNTLYQAFLPHENDPCLMLYTSGTTGFPKGALLSHSMLFWNSVNTTLRLNISQSDCAVTFLPLFHTGGWNVLTTPFLHRGAKIILIKKFDAETILRLSSAEKATLLFGVPTTMEMIARQVGFAKTDLSHLRYAIVGGEPMPIELIHKWHERGIPVRQGYGLTEFGPNVFSLNEADAIRKIGSIGFPNFYIEAKVVDPHSNQELGPQQVGELILKGPASMIGYWKNPKATADTIRNGWLYTGDLVKKDDDGFYYVLGRKKEMYKSGGENVYPAEVEKALQLIEGVREAAVIGVPDPKWGEVGHAFIVLEKPGLDSHTLIDQCKKRLANFKIPKYFSFLKELPKGDTGKVLKRHLQD